MKHFVDTNLKAEHIRLLLSHISISTFMVPKKISTIDLYVIHDHREFNKRTVKYHTLRPHQDEILKLFIWAIIHGKIYLVNAYNQILMHSDNIYKTAFKTPFRLYKCLIIPQVLYNAPANFQIYMNSQFPFDDDPW